MPRVKSLVSAGLLAGALMVGTISGASAAHVVSPQADQQACFGQARAAFASNNVRMGQIISERKGDNARQNAEFREACQSAGE